MLKSRFGILLAALLLFVGIAWLIMALRPSDQKDLEAAYRKLDDSMRNHDLPSFMAMLAPDYQEVRFDGKIRSRQEAEGTYRQIMQDWTRFRDQKFDILKLFVHGKKATVTIERLAVGDLNDSQGSFGPKGKSHTFVSDIMEIDTWNKNQQGWLLRSRQISVAKQLVDGKAIQGKPAQDDHDHVEGNGASH